MGHVVMVPYPAQGHVAPFMQLARFLNAGGAHVTFVHTQFNYRRLLRAKGEAAVRSFPGFTVEVIDDGLPISVPQHDVAALVHAVGRNCLDPFRALLTRLAPVICVVADTVMTFAATAAREAGVPDVAFFTASACGLMGYLQYDELIKRGLVPLKDASCLTTPLDWVPGMNRMRLKDMRDLLPHHRRRRRHGGRQTRAGEERRRVKGHHHQHLLRAREGRRRRARRRLPAGLHRRAASPSPGLHLLLLLRHRHGYQHLAGGRAVPGVARRQEDGQLLGGLLQHWQRCRHDGRADAGVRARAGDVRFPVPVGEASRRGGWRRGGGSPGEVPRRGGARGWARGAVVPAGGGAEARGGGAVRHALRVELAAGGGGGWRAGAGLARARRTDHQLQAGVRVLAQRRRAPEGGGARDRGGAGEGHDGG